MHARSFSLGLFLKFRLFVMEEFRLSYLILCIFFGVLFSFLVRFQAKRPTIRIVNILLHVLAIAIALTVNLLIVSFLYEFSLSLFNINTQGALNFNGIFTAGFLWVVICLLWVALSRKYNMLFGPYYKSLRKAFLVCALLPMALVFVFFLFIFFK